VWDIRWNSPSLNYSLRFPIGDGQNGNCLAMTLIDTVPFMDTYRNRNTQLGPTRSPSTGLPSNEFFEQLEGMVPGDQVRAH